MKKIFLICLFTIVSILNAYAISFKPDYNMRLRYTLYDIQNNYDMFNTSYIRFRNSVGLNTSFDKDSKYNFYVKMLNENYYYFYNVKSKPDDYKINEFIFEQLYFEINNLVEDKLSFKIGRQDLLGYGENFLVCDGTPLDGSRTSYFNAVKFNVSLDLFNIDIIGTLDTLYDQYLPVLNQDDKAMSLNSDYDKSIMLFAKSKFSKDIYVEPYYIYKSEEDTNYYRQINTFGSYLKYKNNGYSIRTQFAVQVKEEKNTQSNAFGGYLFLDKEKILCNDKFTLGYLYLSGNKENTKSNEGWNNLFGRAVVFIKSDMLGILYVPETGVCANWTNLQMYSAEYNINITKKLSASASFNLLYANETISGSAFGNGKNRGNLTLFGLYYSLTKNIKTTLYTEYFCAGDFYNNDFIKSGNFTKAEILMKF